jgi:hypothetical protein
MKNKNTIFFMTIAIVFGLITVVLYSLDVYNDYQVEFYRTNVERTYEVDTYTLEGDTYKIVVGDVTYYTNSVQYIKNESEYNMEGLYLKVTPKEKIAFLDYIGKSLIGDNVLFDVKLIVVVYDDTQDL